MAWEYVVTNQTISFNNLQSAVDQKVFVQKTTIPASNEQITKTDADTYVYLNTSYTPYSDKTSTQLVVKSNLQPTTVCMGGTSSYPYLVSVASDASFYIGGAFSSFSGNSQGRFVKCLQSGYKDTVFNTGSGFNADVYAIAPSGNQVFVGGQEISSYNGTSTGAIVKLNSDGTIDTSFSSSAVGGAFTSKRIDDLGVLSNGKLVVVGDFSNYGSNSTDNGFVLNSNGTFNVNLNLLPNGYVRCLAIQSDNSIVVGGLGNSVVARVTSGGTADTSFNGNHTFSGYLPGSVNNSPEVFGLTILSSGKIVVVGDFTTVNGYSRNGIVILNSDGTVDTNFNPGSAFNKRAFTVKVLYDGRLVVGGDFTSFNGSTNTTSRLMLLNQDGSYYSPTSPSSLFNNEVDSIDLLPGNIIVAVGAFTTFDNQDPCINGDYTAAIQYLGPSSPSLFSLMNCYFNPTPTGTPSPTVTPTVTPIPRYLIQQCGTSTQLTVDFGGGTVTVGNVYQIYAPSCYSGLDGINCWEVLSTSTNTVDCSLSTTGTEFTNCTDCLGYYYTADRYYSDGTCGLIGYNYTIKGYTTYSGWVCGDDGYIYYITSPTSGTYYDALVAQQRSDCYGPC